MTDVVRRDSVVVARGRLARARAAGAGAAPEAEAPPPEPQGEAEGHGSNDKHKGEVEVLFFLVRRISLAVMADERVFRKQCKNFNDMMQGLVRSEQDKHWRR